MQHTPVLAEQVQKYLQLKGGERVVDATLGLGGHSLDILKKIGKKGVLYAFEQDERNLLEAKERLKDFKKQVVYLHDNFCHLKTGVTGKDEAKRSPLLLKTEGSKTFESEKSVVNKVDADDQVDAILFDLGLSSPHVDDAGRGFSFMKEGPLDMRFDQRQKLTAADVVNTYSETQLADIIYHFGEEKIARKIAYLICNRRKTQPFTTTSELAEFLDQSIPKNPRKPRSVHPATKVFQALRIAVNEELDVLNQALDQSMEILKIGGRIVIMSYHSLEDRIVKHFFKKLERPKVAQEEAIYSNFGEPIVESLTKKPVVPSEEEIRENPRSRSAKLRAYVKLRNS